MSEGPAIKSGLCKGFRIKRPRRVTVTQPTNKSSTALPIFWQRCRVFIVTTYSFFMVTVVIVTVASMTLLGRVAFNFSFARAVVRVLIIKVFLPLTIIRFKWVGKVA